MQDIEQQHQDQIIEQFSKQAVPFARLPGHLSSMRMLIELSKAGPDDEVLDVACGPGLVTCEFAPQVRHIEGIDITAAMIEQAHQQQTASGLRNVSWCNDTVDPLPYRDDSFSLVITRYSLHHFLQPRRVLDEMIRVSKPGGRILIADVVIPKDKASAYDRMEIMRDPSHTQVLTSGQLDGWFQDTGLTNCVQGQYLVDVELEAQLRASFPAAGDAERLSEMIEADIGIDDLGINARWRNDEVWFSYPISVFVGNKAG